MAGVLFDGLYNRAPDRSSVGKFSDFRKLLRIGDAEANSHRQSSIPANAPHQVPSIISQLLLGPGNSSTGNSIYKTAACLGNFLQTLIAAGRGRQKDGRQVARLRTAPIFLRFLQGHVSQQYTICADLRGSLAEPLQPHAQYRVAIGKHNQAGIRLFANITGQVENILQRGAIFERPFAGPLDHRPISHRITERDTQFDHIRPRMNRRQDDLPSSSQIRIAAGHISHQAGPLFEAKSCHPISKLSLIIPMSLSPRPETLTIITSDFFIFGARFTHSAMAWADSIAGMIPSVRDSIRQASNASWSEAATYSARPLSASAACSGPMDG